VALSLIVQLSNVLECVEMCNGQMDFEHFCHTKARLKPQEKEAVFFQFLSYAQKLKNTLLSLFLRPLGC
jgi:hypothetical protein